MEEYVSLLPVSDRPKLDKILDWDRKGVETDMANIAMNSMQDWEMMLVTHLNLTHAEVEDIKREWQNKPNLQRYLRIAHNGFGTLATGQK